MARLVTPQPTQIRCRAESRQVIVVVLPDADQRRGVEGGGGGDEEDRSLCRFRVRRRHGLVGAGEGEGGRRTARAWVVVADDGRSRRGGARWPRRHQRRRMCPR